MATIIEEEKQICSMCKNTFSLTSDFFRKKRKFGFTKTCVGCLDKQNNKLRELKCPHGKRKPNCKMCTPEKFCVHGRRKSECRICGGSGICEHGKLKSKCVVCDGTSICEHGKIYYRCKLCSGKSMCEHGQRKEQCVTCKGSAICEHGKRRYRCVLCKGSGICLHGRQKATCVLCKGSSICEHGKQRARCLECKGASICLHGKRREQCKLCTNEVHITIQRMIQESKRKDKKLLRFDEENFIDYDHVKQLIQDSEDKCYYCNAELQYLFCKQDNGATIERLNNEIGHIKSNCVIACWSCNTKRIGGPQKKRKRNE